MCADQHAGLGEGCPSTDSRAGLGIVKVVNADPVPRDVRLVLAGAAAVQPVGRVQVLAAPELSAVNTLDDPDTSLRVLAKSVEWAPISYANSRRTL